MILFGEWRPDAPAWSGQFARVARNVLPAQQGYIPLPALITSGNPVPAAVRGAVAVRKNDRSIDWYAGTIDKLFKFNHSTRAWDDVTQSGGYAELPADDEWSFAQFGTKLIAVNLSVVPQVIDVESGTEFADLGGSPPKARGVSVFRDFVVLFDIEDNPRKIQWSDINNEEVWTPTTSNLAGSQTFPEGGNVTAVTSSETGVVFQHTAMRRMVFVPGSDIVFRFEKMGTDMGLRSPFAYAERGQNLFFLAEDGFYMMSPEGLRNIGAERVNRTFFDDVRTAKLWQVKCVTDPVHPRLYVAYPTNDAAAGVLDKILVYDWQLDRWTDIALEVKAMFKAATAPTSLEDLDDLYDTLEEVTPSLDSRVWLGGAPILGVFDADSTVAFFTGTPMEATIDTPEVRLSAPRRALANWLHPDSDTAALFARVGVRERLADSVSWKSEAQMSSSGRVPVRASGRFHRARVRIPSGVAWTHATGIGVDYNPDGER